MLVQAFLICFVFHLLGSAVGQNAPEFANINYTFTVKENAELETVVAPSIVATLANAGPDSELIYVRCVPERSTPPGSCGLFHLEPKAQSNMQWSGSLEVRAPLSYLQSPSHELVLNATSGLSGTPASFQSVQIEVINVPNLPPIFTSALTATIEERHVVGREIIRLVAVDGDRTDRDIRYFIVQDPGKYFSIDDISGDLKNERPLLLNDSNWSTGFMTIIVQAVAMYNDTYIPFEDPLSVTNASVTITLRSSDTSPRFGQPFYHTSLKENSAVDTVVPNLNIIIQSKNLASGAGFTLQLSDYNDRFRISPTNGTQTVTASIIVANSSLLDVDYGQEYYSFLVIAEDVVSKKRSSANVTIRLIDINDHQPVFQSTALNASVNEMAGQGTLVIKVQATDDDFNSLGNGNGSIRYRLRGYTSLFDINTETGDITVKLCHQLGTCIDYERQPGQRYQLTVMAADQQGEGHHVRVPVTVHVVDANDNPPEFVRNEYGISVLENRSVFVPPLIVEATDIDSPYNDNNKITYVIRSTGGAPAGLFVINSTTGEITMTRPVLYTDTPSNLGNFTLIVTANNPPQPPTVTTVIIRVIPVNLFPPVFENNGYYEVYIPEDSPLGMSVDTVLAEDDDAVETPGGQVKYRFVSGSRDQFSINETTGVVTVGPIGPLSYAVQSLYNITVEAVDQGQPQKTAIAYLVVHVLPRNFTGIAFVPPIMRVSVVTNTPVNTLVLNITVHKGNPNTIVRYNLSEPYNGRTIDNRDTTLTPEQKTWFRVDPLNGQLRVNGNVSRETIKVWQSLVIAVDNSTQTTATGTLIITILEPRSPPRFIPPWTPESPYYTLTIPERRPPGTYLTTMVTEPNVNIVRYFLHNDSDEFNIVNDTGVVTIARLLDYDESPNRTFVVVAYDNGVPSLSSTATVFVQLSDINNYPPVFDPAVYRVEIYENSEAGTFVVDVNATDRDSGDYGDIRYRLVDNPNNAFTIDPLTGVITVLPNAVLDREQIPDVVLSVEAHDCPNTPVQRQYAFSTVTITLLDVNDNPPVFAPSYYLKSVPDWYLANETILTVRADDEDTGDNSHITYEIVNSTQPGGRSQTDGSRGPNNDLPDQRQYEPGMTMSPAAICESSVLVYCIVIDPSSSFLLICYLLVV